MADKIHCYLLINHVHWHYVERRLPAPPHILVPILELMPVRTVTMTPDTTIREKTLVFSLYDRVGKTEYNYLLDAERTFGK